MELEYKFEYFQQVVRRQIINISFPTSLLVASNMAMPNRKVFEY